MGILRPHSTVVLAVIALNDSQVTACHNISDKEKVIEGTHPGLCATSRQASAMMVTTGWGRELFMFETESLKVTTSLLLTLLNEEKKGVGEGTYLW